MTYRQQMPPGQAFPGQQPPQHPMYPQYGDGNGPNGYNSANQQYQHGQNVYPSYANAPQPQPLPTPQPQVYPNHTPQTSHSPPPQYPAYDNPVHRPPPSEPPPSQFVNPMDLQNVFSAAPMYRAPAPLPPVQPAAQPAPHIEAAHSVSETQPVSQAQVAYAQPAPPTKPLQAPTQSAPRPQQSRSAQNSPRMLNGRPPSSQGSRKDSTPTDPRRLSSGSAVQKSPVVTNASTPAEIVPLLLYIADDCLSKAKEGAEAAARSMTTQHVNDHHKMISTGLTCLEVALQSNTIKSKPRLEAKILLRYATTLVEETTNTMEAEVALKKVQTISETHRFQDLNHSAQFVLMKAMFQRNSKAALINIDHKISDCTTYKNIHWVYAFRFLKASFYLQLGTAADHHAIDNLRTIAKLAKDRGDNAIFVVATLMEGLAQLSTTKEDAVTRVQTCIAQASTFQLDESVHLPQVDILLMFLDLACSLREKASEAAFNKWMTIQARLGELRSSPAWNKASTELLLPVAKQPGATQSPAGISADTSAILRPGTNNNDFLVLSTLGKREIDALTHALNGLTQLNKPLQTGQQIGISSVIWAEGLKLMEDHQSTAHVRSLPEALRAANWEMELYCYTNILTGLQSATLSEWPKVAECLTKIGRCELSGPLEPLALYLSGVLKQGTAQLAEAFEIWKDPKFALDTSGAYRPSNAGIEADLALLAALNRIWIMQNPGFADETKVQEMVDFFTPLCVDHPDKEIKTVCNLALAAIHSPALSIHKAKRHIQLALSASQETSNSHHLSISLNVLRCRLFDNVVGVQALKSAKAGSTQAKKGGNILWMSVADGMLAQSFDMQGSMEEGAAARALGTQHANAAMSKIDECPAA